MRIFAILTFTALAFLNPAEGADWGGFNAKGCRSCGEQIFHSRLWNIVGDWLTACQTTEGRPPGSPAPQFPYYCEDKGLGGMWGHFNVSTSWGTCDTGSSYLGELYWSNFRDDGCTVEGYRLWSARLWNIDGNWDETCAVTKGRPMGEECVVPTRCENGGTISGIWGKFYIQDPLCPKI